MGGEAARPWLRWGGWRQPHSCSLHSALHASSQPQLPAKLREGHLLLVLIWPAILQWSTAALPSPPSPLRLANRPPLRVSLSTGLFASCSPRVAPLRRGYPRGGGWGNREDWPVLKHKLGVEERERNKCAAEGKVNGRHMKEGRNERGQALRRVADREPSGGADGGKTIAQRWSVNRFALARGPQPKEGSKRTGGDTMAWRAVPGRGSPGRLSPSANAPL